MPRFWVISPYRADQPDVWGKVWDYDLEHGVISIGWSKLRDVSSLNDDQLRQLVDRTYPENPPANRKFICRIFHDFYHAVKPGDRVIARRGMKKLAAIGTVKRAAYYEPTKNSEVLPNYPHHLDVEWADAPRDKAFDSRVFGMQTMYKISEEKFRSLSRAMTPAPEKGLHHRAKIVLEKYLEEFIVSNFDTIFKKELVLYSDPDQGPLGQQFHTDVGVIDILAQDASTGAFVIIELKKGRQSDKVVGQVLRYMGWVAENLGQPDQDVRGIVICKAPDPRLLYALKMVKNVSVKYYRVDFELADTYQAQIESAMRAGWDDPVMDEYNDYDEQRKR